MILKSKLKQLKIYKLKKYQNQKILKLFQQNKVVKIFDNDDRVFLDCIIVRESFLKLNSNSLNQVDLIVKPVHKSND